MPQGFGSTPHYRAAGPGVVLVWKFECARVCFLALGRFSHGGDKLHETPLGPSKVGLRARCWNHSETEAMVIPWVLDQTIVAMLSSLLPFYVQSLAIRRMGPRWP